MNGFRKASQEYSEGAAPASPGLFLLLSLGSPLAAVTVDRVAALIDRQVLTVSEVSQMVEIRLFPRSPECRTTTTGTRCWSLS